MTPCQNHPDHPAVECCEGCGGSFCDPCLVWVRGAAYCEECKYTEIDGPPQHALHSTAKVGDTAALVCAGLSVHEKNRPNRWWPWIGVAWNGAVVLLVVVRLVLLTLNRLSP